MLSPSVGASGCISSASSSSCLTGMFGDLCTCSDGAPVSDELEGPGGLAVVGLLHYQDRAGLAVLPQDVGPPLKVEGRPVIRPGLQSEE